MHAMLWGAGFMMVTFWSGYIDTSSPMEMDYRVRCHSRVACLCFVGSCFQHWQLGECHGGAGWCVYWLVQSLSVFCSENFAVLLSLSSTLGSSLVCLVGGLVFCP